MKNDNNTKHHNLSSSSLSLEKKLSEIQNVILSLEIITQNLVGARRVAERNLKTGANALELGLIRCFLASAYANAIDIDLKILAIDKPITEPCKPDKPSLRLVSDKAKPIFTDTDYPGV